MAYRAGERSVFLYGFGKNERDNIDGDELARYGRIACTPLALTIANRRAAVPRGRFSSRSH